MRHLIVRDASLGLAGSCGHKSMRHLIGMDASQCVTCPSSYGLQAMCHLVAMDESQCVTWLLWTQVNVSPGSYGRMSMCYLLVTAACHASSVSYGRKSMCYLEVMDPSQCVTCPGSYGRKLLWAQVNALSGVMDVRRCVPYWLWTQVKASPRSYRRKSTCHLVVWTQVNVSHGS